MVNVWVLDGLRIRQIFSLIFSLIGLLLSNGLILGNLMLYQLSYARKVLPMKHLRRSGRIR